jgi:hypothetical protein
MSPIINEKGHNFHTKDTIISKRSFVQNSERKASVPVTVREHTLALRGTYLRAHTRQEVFCDGSQASDVGRYMFKAVELNRRTAEAVERGKDMKSRVEYHARHEVHTPSSTASRMSWKKRYRAAKKEGAGRAASVEGCACVNNGECCEQTHPLPAICKGRHRGGKHVGPLDGNQRSGTPCWAGSHPSWSSFLR